MRYDRRVGMRVIIYKNIPLGCISILRSLNQISIRFHYHWYRYSKNYTQVSFHHQLIDRRIRARYSGDWRVHLKENCCVDSRVKRLENSGKSSFSSRYVMPALCCSESHVQHRLMNLKWPCEFFAIWSAKNGGFARLPKVAIRGTPQFRWWQNRET